MIFKHNFYFNFFLILIYFLLSNCQIQKTTKNHGILFLKNRYNKLIVNKTNTNDVLQIVGNTHTKSISNKKTWIYIERVLSKGKYHKFGKNIIAENNVMVLTFNKHWNRKE